MSKPSSIRSQATFASTTDCLTFVPNRLKPDICTECYQKIFSHTCTAVTDDHQIQAALEYGNKGRKTPSTILSPKDSHPNGCLYLGGYASVLNRTFLTAHNITGIVNTAKGLEMFGPRWVNGLAKVKDSGIQCLELNWIDSEEQEVSASDLTRTVEFMRRHRDNGNVLVHCAQGKSRSTTVVCAFLMAEDPAVFTTPHDALTFVKTKRVMAQPNRHFMKQLQTHHKNGLFAHLHAQKDVAATVGVETKEARAVHSTATATTAEIPATTAVIPAIPVIPATSLCLSNANAAAIELIHVVDSVMQKCPWTKTKTANQLVQYTKSELEEIQEAMDIEMSKNSGACHPSDDLESEVGDLLFDALLLARIVERDFTGCSLERMLERACQKIQRRCPHVFDGEPCASAEDAAAIWQREKSKEKKQSESSGVTPDLCGV